MDPKILNSKGEEITLNAREKKIADVNQRIVNELGFEINITTMTQIMKRVIEQKFFEIAPADYLPVRVGEGAWSTNLVTYRSFALGDDFSTGVVNTGGNNGRLAAVGAGIDSVSIAVKNWAKEIGWTLMEVEQALRAGNWDLITQLEKSRKQNWDLGIQGVAFLGLSGDSSVKGLYNQSGITTNTALITKKLNVMTGTELKAFCAAILDAYRTNCSRTAWPTHFIMPESDFLGLAAPSNADFHMKSVLQVLEETFQIMTKNKNFQVLPNAYGDAAYNGSLNKTRYILLNYNEDSLRMDIPVNYTNTLANSINNFSFQNVGYGQFSGVLAYRPLELLYLDLTP